MSIVPAQYRYLVPTLISNFRETSRPYPFDDHSHTLSVANIAHALRKAIVHCYQQLCCQTICFPNTYNLVGSSPLNWNKVFLWMVFPRLYHHTTPPKCPRKGVMWVTSNASRKESWIWILASLNVSMSSTISDTDPPSGQSSLFDYEQFMSI